jgi:hypothetical protein
MKTSKHADVILAAGYGARGNTTVENTQGVNRGWDVASAWEDRMIVENFLNGLFKVFNLKVK